ncbi:MAG: ATP-NAD kinase family protein [Methanolinea sp.]|nr:ATP-NAD kinase family protein [Methanolinea sp.]
MHTVGFLVNPVAGMGGAVGLKGTDGLVAEAIRRGAQPRAPRRAEETARLLRGLPARFLTSAGPMGEEVLIRAGIGDYEVVYTPPGRETGPDDTKATCRAFLERGVELILFCGGDGTARDIYSVVGDSIPLLGIPAGVKMYSGVFAVTPAAAAEILRQGWGAGRTLHCQDAEVVDVDEEAYRQGTLSTRIFGIARTPYRPGFSQLSKQVFEDPDEERAKKEIARFLREVMEGTPDILYILGPGGTTAAIAGELGIKKTILGFDAVKAGRLEGLDLNEGDIRALLGHHPRARLVVSILGAQGAVLGRGTQQISPSVIRTIGKDNIIVVATPHKLAKTPFVFIDTGDRELDREFGEFITVVTGYRVARRVRVAGSGEPHGSP